MDHDSVDPAVQRGRAVHPDLEYGEYETEDGRKLILAISRAEDPALARDLRLKGRIGQPVPGSSLAGLRYRRPLDVVPLPAHKKHSVVIAGDFVTADTGSGMVHMAPAFGADDYAAGRKNDLALLMPVAPDGTFKGTTWPEIEGKLVTDKETNETIIRTTEG